MDRIKLYCRGTLCGEAAADEKDGRWEIRAEIEDPKDGLYRAVLVGDRGELSLGVLEPRDGKLILCRKPALCDVKRLGTVREIRAGCSFPFRKEKVWQVSDRPSELFSDPLIRKGLALHPQIRWRRERNGIRVALPLKTDEPFPLESFFCFARVERVEGETCVVFLFDENGMPVYEKNSKTCG